jgi:hypothetical protein
MEAFSDLRLVGGTALALQIGHRKSIDLDFFGIVDFDQIDTFESFRHFDSAEQLQKSKNINIFEINNIKVDFVNYAYPWLKEKVIVEDIVMAHAEDIAAMKVAAITGRGSRKDFIDLFFLLQRYTLSQILGLYSQKYFDASPYLALKSLTYFDDAEQEESPEMIIKTDWEEVKETIIFEVKRYIGL